MVTEVQSAEIECPQCRENFPRPLRVATATCPRCGASSTLIDQVMDGSLVVHGQLVTRGKIVVGPQARIKANLSGTEIEIDGAVEGNVTAVEKLSLGSHAKLNGNAIAAKLVMAPGACFTGKFSIGPSKSRHAA